MDTSGCDAAAAQILSGKKAGVKGNVVAGTMVNRAGTTVQAAAVTQDDDNTYFAVPEAAYYDKNSKIATANSNLNSSKTYSVTIPWVFNAGFDARAEGGYYIMGSAAVNGKFFYNKINVGTKIKASGNMTLTISIDQNGNIAIS